MPDQKLIDILKEELKKGVSEEVIVTNLISNGWNQEDIDLAFLQIKQTSFASFFHRFDFHNKNIVFCFIVALILLMFFSLGFYCVNNHIVNLPFFISNDSKAGNLNTLSQNSKVAKILTPNTIKAKITKLYTASQLPIADSLYFSANHKHFTYNILGTASGSAGFNFDGKIIRPQENLFGNPILSGDGTGIAYIDYNSLEKKYFGVINGVNTPFYDRVNIIPNPSDNTFAYIARQSGKEFAVVNNQQGKKYQQINTLTFSPDGKQWAYIAQISPGQETMILNNHDEKVYSQISDPEFSSDGKLFVYQAVGCSQTTDNTCLVVNGREIQSYDNINTLPVFSPNGKYYLFIGEKGVGINQKDYIVLNGVEDPKPYKNIRSYAVSDTGKVIFSALTLDNKLVVVINGKEISVPSTSNSPEVYISPDGERYAYLVNNVHRSLPVFMESYYVIDGREDRHYGSVESAVNYMGLFAVGNFQFSSDSKHYIYTIDGRFMNGLFQGSAVNIDGHEDRIYSDFDIPSFSFDGKSVEYNALEGQDILLIKQSLENPDIVSSSNLSMNNVNNWQYYTDTLDQVKFKYPPGLFAQKIGNGLEASTSNISRIIFLPQYYQQAQVPLISYYIDSFSSLDSFENFERLRIKGLSLNVQSLSGGDNQGNKILKSAITRKVVNGRDFSIITIEANVQGSIVNQYYYSFVTKSGKVGGISVQTTPTYSNEKLAFIQRELIKSLDF